MKNVIFTLAFMLFGSFAFANTSSNEVNSKLLAIKIVEYKTAKEGKIENYIHVSLSCGVEYDICNFQGTTIQLINLVLNSNNNICGTGFDMLD